MSLGAILGSFLMNISNNIPSGVKKLIQHNNRVILELSKLQKRDEANNDHSSARYFSGVKKGIILTNKQIILALKIGWI